MRRLLAPLLVIAIAANVLGQAGDPDKWVGTWKLNKAKSSAGAPESATTTIEAIPGGIRVVSDTTNRAGITNHTEYAAKFDGRAVPVQAVVSGATAAVKRINKNTFEVVIESQGTRTVSRNVISADGKTRKVTQTLTLSIGDLSNNMIVLVYDKEP